MIRIFLVFLLKNGTKILPKKFLNLVVF